MSTIFDYPFLWTPEAEKNKKPIKGSVTVRDSYNSPTFKTTKKDNTMTTNEAIEAMHREDGIEERRAVWKKRRGYND